MAMFAKRNRTQSQSAAVSPDQMRAKVYACWLGKSVGGTLGAPFEGAPGPHSVEFYTPVPTEMLPNDDLDLQVAWACALDRMKAPRVDRLVLASAWQEHVAFPMDEYGVALRNLAEGLKPPLTGSYDNFFIHGMGAAIRSEIWACLAPGDPELAAAYAYEDACVDHAGEGIWAEVFLAALESAAFTESDPQILLNTSLARLPENSLVRQAATDTRAWWKRCPNWQEVRDRILKRYGHENCTDVTMNMAFIVLAWLAGGSDFGKAICTAVNCGMDTDCTAATVGSLMGILDPTGIPPKWIAPIGQHLVVSREITGLDLPSSLDRLTEMVLNLYQRLDRTSPAPDTPKQSTDHLRIPTHAGFIPQLPPYGDKAPQMPPNSWPLVLPGTLGEMSRKDFLDDVLLIRYHLFLPMTRSVRILFNSREANRVWLNGAYLFGRNGGPMTPSAHRGSTADQRADLELPAGTHELTAAIQRPGTEHKTCQWVVCVADAKSLLWLPGVFRQPHTSFPPPDQS